ncbi:hypothetical protein GHT09_006456 [Marmota monax]|uniref:Uncharacterized protein n=1 Tax=Marmota monax TaxID=9995 RepID=A0A834PS08_MARMO|nr:hypothetical protein GHT09_006456 [Marmota monax]
MRGWECCMAHTEVIESCLGRETSHPSLEEWRRVPTLPSRKKERERCTSNRHGVPKRTAQGPAVGTADVDPKFQFQGGHRAPQDGVREQRGAGFARTPFQAFQRKQGGDCECNNQAVSFPHEPPRPRLHLLADV